MEGDVRSHGVVGGPLQTGGELGAWAACSAVLFERSLESAGLGDGHLL